MTIKCDEVNICEAYKRFAQKDDHSKGLGQMNLMDITQDVRDESAIRCVPMYRYGKAKKDTVAINYCPFLRWVFRS